jgi:hypothetical protein
MARTNYFRPGSSDFMNHELVILKEKITPNGKAKGKSVILAIT